MVGSNEVLSPDEEKEINLTFAGNNLKTSLKEFLDKENSNLASANSILEQYLGLAESEVSVSKTELYSALKSIQESLNNTNGIVNSDGSINYASTIYVPVLNAQTEKDAQLSGLKLQYIPDFENFLKRGFSKMVIPGDPEELLVLQQILKDKFGEKCSVFTSKPYYLEIQSAGAGKGEALMWLAEYLNLEPETVMAFGDSMNDETMMKLAPLSVAMVNGIDAIKQVARFVTEYSNNEDGVARFIETYTV